MPPVNPNEVIEYNGSPMRIKDVPDTATRHFLGLGHFREDRPTLPGAWPYSPENCIYTDPCEGNKWVNGGQTLVCTGCGLDVT